MTISIYTDGSAHCKTQYGAWAFIVVHPDGRTEPHSHSYEGVTNNKMELMAVLEGLNYILETRMQSQPPFPQYRIISDSEYVVQGINDWRHGWKLKQWKNVKNLPLWLAIDSTIATINTLGIGITVSWVKGHNGDKYNELCDKLAHGEYQKLSDSKTAV